MQCSDKHTDTDIERRNRLIEDVYPALRRMAGRHRQKAGLPWQYRDDLAHDLVVKLCDVYRRYSHLDDESIKRLFIKAAHEKRIEATRRSERRSDVNAGSSVLDYVEVANHGIAMVDTIDEVVVMAKRAGWTRKELQAVLLLAQGHSLREAAIKAGEGRGKGRMSIHRLACSARRKAMRCAKNTPQLGTRYQPHGDNCQ